MTTWQRSLASAREDRIVRFVNQFLIRLAAIAVACLLAVYGHMASTPDAGDQPRASAIHAAQAEPR